MNKKQEFDLALKQFLIMLEPYREGDYYRFPIDSQFQKMIKLQFEYMWSIKK